MNTAALFASLALACFGLPALQALAIRAGWNRHGYAARTPQWLLAAGAVGLALHGDPGARVHIGIATSGAASLLYGLLGALAILALAGALRVLAQRRGQAGIESTDSARAIAALGSVQRVFLVATAAVCEETLYRGIGIGIGAVVSGSSALAVLAATVAFVLAHLRWGSAHLPFVGAAAVVLGVQFAVSGDLAGCMIAHALVDGFGLLLAPWLWRRRMAGPG